MMGTVVTLEACGLPEPELDVVIGQAYHEIETVDELMSVYREDSEISRVNRQPIDTAMPLSEPTFDVLVEAVHIAEASKGAFDPTIGSLVKLWGFDRGEPALPDSETLAQAMAQIGFQFIRLDRQTATIQHTRPGVELDLGAIAKGYAVDRALAVLKVAGVTRAVVDLGESSVCVFDEGDSIPFIIRNTSPRSITFEIQDGCVATSGNDQQGFERDGQWFSHILDPRTGWPVRDTMSSTVVARIGQGMRADALATAGFVAGAEGALDLWQRFGVEGMLLYRAEGTIQSVRTPGFPVSTTAP
jgi:thiamine biosynthesis lipoprotein